MTDLEKALWIPTGVLGATTIGLGAYWAYYAHAYATCEAQSEGFQRLACFSPGLAAGIAQRFFIISGVLTAIAGTTVAVVHYRRKRR